MEPVCSLPWKCSAADHRGNDYSKHRNNVSKSPNFSNPTSEYILWQPLYIFGAIRAHHSGLLLNWVILACCLNGYHFAFQQTWKILVKSCPKNCSDQKQPNVCRKVNIAPASNCMDEWHRSNEKGVTMSATSVKWKTLSYEITHFNFVEQHEFTLEYD